MLATTSITGNKDEPPVLTISSKTQPPGDLMSNWTNACPECSKLNRATETVTKINGYHLLTGPDVESTITCSEISQTSVFFDKLRNLPL